MTINKSIKKRFKKPKDYSGQYHTPNDYLLVEPLTDKIQRRKASHSQPLPGPLLHLHQTRNIHCSVLIYPHENIPTVPFSLLPAQRPYIPSPDHHHNNLLITSRAYTFPSVFQHQQARESTRTASVFTMKRTYHTATRSIRYSIHTQKTNVSLISRPLWQNVWRFMDSDELGRLSLRVGVWIEGE